MTLHFAIIAVRLIVVLLGALIVYLALKSYRKNNSSAMLFLGIGFGIITASAVVEGILFEFFGFSLLDTHLIESLGLALGFSVIIYSIFGPKT